MLAIVSDIHGNLEALQVVLADIESQHVERVACLGDFVGYGPNPKECIDLAYDFDITLRGNHEEGLLEEFQTATFNPRARSSLDWTREQLSMLSADRDSNATRWDFLGALEVTHEEDSVLYVHGTPRDPISEYLYPRDVFNLSKLADIFSRFQWLCFAGHTHIPGVWTEDATFLSPEDLSAPYEFTDKKTFINAGSVGQPRNGDPRACYVLFDGDSISFRKLDYPVKKTVEKIRSIPALDPFLGTRILQGR